jgi:predicted protein tyrosine phosphatase
MTDTERRSLQPLQVAIESRYSIAEKIRNNNSLLGEACISILSPDSPDIPEIRECFPELLRLRFDDITDESEHAEEYKPVLFSKSHLRKILRFYRRIKKRGIRKLTVHCHAGVHRSTAVGLIILYLETKSLARAKEEIIRARAIPLPNKRVISLFDQRFNTNLIQAAEELDARFRSYVHDEITIDRDDYLEELEVVD